MAKTLTAAVIGAGAIAQALHLPGYSKRDEVTRIVAVDPVEERFAEITEKFRVDATYTDHREMLKTEHPDVVSICTPNCFHAELAIAALESGADVLLEKPMTMTLDSAKEVAAVAERLGKRVMIGFTHRFHGSNGKVKELLEQNAIGEPFMIRVRFAHSGPFPGWAKSDWFYKPEMAGGGALLDMGIHAIDLCQWFLGPVTSVAAQMGTLRKDIAVDDNALLALTIGDRALGYIEVGWTSPAGFIGFEIYGDQGAIINDYQAKLRVCRGKISPDQGSISSLTWEDVEDSTCDGGDREFNYFIDTILSGKPLVPGLQDGITSLAVALAAIDSARNGKRVELETLAAR